MKTDYFIGDCFLSTSTSYQLGTTMVVSDTIFSSNATSTGDPYHVGSSYYSWSQNYPKPPRTRNTYQCMFYNPTTNAIACEILAEEIGLSTGSTQDYLPLATVAIPGSTQAGFGRAYALIEGLFNGVGAQFRFYNPTTCAAADNTTTLHSYMAIKEYL